MRAPAVSHPSTYPAAYICSGSLYELLVDTLSFPKLLGLCTESTKTPRAMQSGHQERWHQQCQYVRYEYRQPCTATRLGGGGG